MRNVVYSVAMSLDGYIAAPDGGYDWIVMDPDIDFGAIFARFDTFLLGRKTFELTQQGGPPLSGKVVVFSTTLDPARHPGVTIVRSDPKAAVEALKAEPGKDIWLFGGGELFRTLLEAEVVDRIGVAVIPVVLGGGLPLLPPPARRASLRLLEHRLYPKTGIVSLDYAVEYRQPAGKRRRGGAKQTKPSA